MREYKTQMEAAKKGIITPEMQTVAAKEYMEPEKLRELVAKGWVAIPANVRHTALSAEGVGSGLKTKINVNLGISGDCKDYTMEMQKVDMAIKFGAEAIMDLSNYGKTNTFRKQLVERSPAMIGTVPMYDAIGYMEKPLVKLTKDDLLEVVRFKYPRAYACADRIRAYVQTEKGFHSGQNELLYLTIHIARVMEHPDEK